MLKWSPLIDRSISTMKWLGTDKILEILLAYGATYVTQKNVFKMNRPCNFFLVSFVLTRQHKLLPCLEQFSSTLSRHQIATRRCQRGLDVSVSCTFVQQSTATNNKNRNKLSTNFCSIFSAHNCFSLERDSSQNLIQLPRVDLDWSINSL